MVPRAPLSPVPAILAGLQNDAEDRNEIIAILDRQVEAWNLGDAADYSADIDLDCVMTNVAGDIFVGRASFEAIHSRIFSTMFAGSRMSQAIRHMRFLRPDVAIVDTDVQIADWKGLPPDVRSAPDGVLHTRLEQVFTRELGGWRIAAYHNIDVKHAPEPG